MQTNTRRVAAWAGLLISISSEAPDASKRPGGREVSWFCSFPFLRQGLTLQAMLAWNSLWRLHMWQCWCLHLPSGAGITDVSQHSKLEREEL